MGLSHGHISTPASTPEVSPAPTRREAPNTRAAEFPAAQDDSRLAAEAILAANPLASFFYDSLVADPLTCTRDALFTAFVLDWPGFNAMLTTVDCAASAERGLTSDPEREGLLSGLRSGIALGKRAYQVLPTEWELDVLLGLCDANTAPVTAEFITLAYDAERGHLGSRLRAHAGDDPVLADGATRLMTLLNGPDTCAVGDEAGEPTGSWFDRGVNSLVDGHADLVDTVVESAADVPLLGVGTQSCAALAKTSVQYAGGVTKGFGALVGGIANMAQHPIEATKGLLVLAEHVPGSPLKLLHKLTDVATGHKTLAEALFTNDLAEDLDFLKQVVRGMAQPTLDAIASGKPAEAAGRAAFDIGSMFLGVGNLRVAGTGSRFTKMLGTKGDDLAKAAGLPRNAAKATSGVTDAFAKMFGTKGDDLAKAGGTEGKAAKATAGEEVSAGTKDAARAGVAAEAAATIAKKAPLRTLSGEAFEARVSAILRHPLLSGDMKQLDKVLADARRGESGAIGELSAVERWLDEGKTVEVLTEVQQQGLRNPDYRVSGRLTEVKTRVKPLSQTYVKDEIKAANNQVKNSKHGEVGEVQIQLDGDAATDDFASIEAQVRAQFHVGCSRSLDRVTILQDGIRVGEWVRGPDGAVTRAFPLNGAKP